MESLNGEKDIGDTTVCDEPKTSANYYSSVRTNYIDICLGGLSKSDLQPNELLFCRSLIIKRIGQAKKQEVEVLLAKALAVSHQFPELCYLEVIVLEKAGRIKEATELIQHLVKIHDTEILLLDYVEFLIRHKKPDEALVYLNDHKVSNSVLENTLNRKGELLLELNELGKASACFDAALKIRNDFRKAALNKARVLLLIQNVDAAISLANSVYKKSLSLEALNLLGVAYRKSNQMKRARVALENALSRQAEFVPAIINYANVLNDTGRLEEAEKYYNLATAAAPQNQSLYLNKAKLYNNFGKQGNAIINYKIALELNPKDHESIYGLSRLVTEDEDIKLIESSAQKLLEEPSDDYKRLYYYYTMARVHKLKGDLKECVNLLNIAGNLNSRIHHYETEREAQLFKKIKLEYQTARSKNEVSSKENIVPIFIVGMPRSGTTLLEQMLGMHSSVTAYGETGIIDEIMVGMFDFIGTPNLSSGNGFSQKLSEIYFERISQLDKVQREYLTDKTPLNFKWIGQLVESFPNGKIIHITRTPEATCWSNFENFFPSPDMAFASEQVSVSEYYLMYLDIMRHWSNSYSKNIFNISYERLTENPTEVLKDVCNWCNLDWQPIMLDFHKNKGPVKTASNLQVRRQLYQGSSTAWEGAKPFLGRMLDALKP